MKSNLSTILITVNFSLRLIKSSLKNFCLANFSPIKLSPPQHSLHLRIMKIWWSADLTIIYILRYRSRVLLYLLMQFSWTSKPAVLSCLLRAAITMNVAHSGFLKLFANKSKRDENGRRRVMCCQWTWSSWSSMLSRDLRTPSHVLFVQIADKSRKRHTREISERKIQENFIKKAKTNFNRLRSPPDNAFASEIWLSLPLSRARECFYPVINF